MQRREQFLLVFARVAAPDDLARPSHHRQQRRRLPRPGEVGTPPRLHHADRQLETVGAQVLDRARVPGSHERERRDPSIRIREEQVHHQLRGLLLSLPPLRVQEHDLAVPFRERLVLRRERIGARGADVGARVHISPPLDRVRRRHLSRNRRPGLLIDGGKQRRGKTGSEQQKRFHGSSRQGDRRRANTKSPRAGNVRGGNALREKKTRGELAAQCAEPITCGSALTCARIACP